MAPAANTPWVAAARRRRWIAALLICALVALAPTIVILATELADGWIGGKADDGTMLIEEVSSPGQREYLYRIDSLHQALPESYELLAGWTECAERAGLAVVDAKLAAADTSSGVTGSALTLRVSGSFSRIASFCAELDRLRPVVHVAIIRVATERGRTSAELRIVQRQERAS
jgi:hypothetical protein